MYSRSNFFKAFIAEPEFYRNVQELLEYLGNLSLFAVLKKYFSKTCQKQFLKIAITMLTSLMWLFNIRGNWLIRSIMSSFRLLFLMPFCFNNFVIFNRVIRFFLSGFWFMPLFFFLFKLFSSSDRSYVFRISFKKAASRKTVEESRWIWLLR